ncbi:MAG: hypothetical protein ACRDGM_16205 [bacterium]
MDSLFGVNVIGYVNHEARPQERVRIKIHGVIVDGRGRPLNLLDFREPLPDPQTGPGPEPHLIAVAGYSSDAGKTTCAWALVSELQKRGFSVTVEKKTGTACCREWLRCYADPRIGALEHEGDELVFNPDTRGFFGHRRPDFHIIGLADSISHVSNSRLLRSGYFRRSLRTLVYVSIPTYEAVGHFWAYLRALGYHRAPVLLSGRLANEAQCSMARDEITARLGLPICRSAIQEDGRWIPDGGQLANAVLEESPRRPAAKRGGESRDVHSSARPGGARH